MPYNNTGKNENERSNASISDKEILKVLNKKGKFEVFESKYKTFTTGKSQNNTNKERLFVCKVGK